MHPAFVIPNHGTRVPTRQHEARQGRVVNGELKLQAEPARVYDGGATGTAAARVGLYVPTREQLKRRPIPPKVDRDDRVP